MSARPSTGRADAAGVAVRRSVLVADDDPLALRALGLILRMDAYDVRLAATGREALAAVTTSAPDLVVVDHDMRGVDGMSLPEAIQNVAPDVPLVVVLGTGEAVAAALERAPRLSRPIDAERLRHEVARQLAPPADRRA
jgi:DNA-binding NtrC family response regulator